MVANMQKIPSSVMNLTAQAQSPLRLLRLPAGNCHVGPSCKART